MPTSSAGSALSVEWQFKEAVQRGDNHAVSRALRQDPALLAKSEAADRSSNQDTVVHTAVRRCQ